MEKIICNDTGEEFNNYNDYLSSKHWKGIKERYWNSKLPKNCYVCHTKENLNLHHKTYKRIGRENLLDLVYLCKEHHHQLHKEYKDMNIRKAGKRLKRKYAKTHKTIRN